MKRRELQSRGWRELRLEGAEGVVETDLEAAAAGWSGWPVTQAVTRTLGDAGDGQVPTMQRLASDPEPDGALGWPDTQWPVNTQRVQPARLSTASQPVHCQPACPLPASLSAAVTNTQPASLFSTQPASIPYTASPAAVRPDTYCSILST